MPCDFVVYFKCCLKNATALSITSPNHRAWVGEVASAATPIRATRRDGEAMLFNLETDIAEKDNLITQHPDIANDLAMQWEKWDAAMDESANGP